MTTMTDAVLPRPAGPAGDEPPPLGTLLLVLSFGGSLRRWREDGILFREMELYLHHLRTGRIGRLAVMSYDSRDTVDLVEAPEDLRARITLVKPDRPLRSRIGRLAWSLSPRTLARLRATGADLCKTNQISGSWTAVALGVAGMPVFARCGYLLSRREAKNGRTLGALLARLLERALFRTARLVSVTTEEAAGTVRALVPPERRGDVFVALTYVPLDVFRADAAAKPDDPTVVFVGRLEPQKNVLEMVRACHLAGMPLLVVGSGSLRQAVDDLAADLGASVRVVPRLENREIADLYRRHRYFLLPSLHEGLPKALIEAMASEMICVGTDVPGVNDLIRDGETGYLAPATDAASIAAALRRAAEDPDAVRTARRARAAVLANHSLEGYAALEHARMAAALGAGPGRG